MRMMWVLVLALIEAIPNSAVNAPVPTDIVFEKSIDEWNVVGGTEGCAIAWLGGIETTAVSKSSVLVFPLITAKGGLSRGNKITFTDFYILSEFIPNVKNFGERTVDQGLKVEFGLGKKTWYIGGNFLDETGDIARIFSPRKEKFSLTLGRTNVSMIIDNKFMVIDQLVISQNLLDLIQECQSETLRLNSAQSFENGTKKERISRPKNNPGTWVNPSSYPKLALSEGRTGKVYFTLEIDEYGKPTRCTIRISSGHLDIDEITCQQLMSNAEFYPATNEDGKPIASKYEKAVDWRALR